MERRLRYGDLRAAGIVRNRTTLKNRIKKQGFPPGKLTGPNERTWGEGEIQAYIDSRPTEPKPAPVLKEGSRRGRPPKAKTTPKTTGAEA